MRSSQKRQCILDCLKSTDTHPTAEWVWERVRTTFPHLSLATVYRNLKQLQAEGLIRSVGTVQGQERFDAALLPHSHIVCRRCGCVVDVGIVPPAALAEQAGAATGFSVSMTDLRFEGLCPACRKKEDHHG